MHKGASKPMGNSRLIRSATHGISIIDGRTQRQLTVFGCALVAAGLLLSGCSSKDASPDPPTVTVQAVAAENGPIQSVISADATLYARDQAAIVPNISAPVKKFYVDRGSKVRAGQLLAELENQDLAGAVTENEGGYQQAEANYQTAVQSAIQN